MFRSRKIPILVLLLTLAALAAILGIRWVSRPARIALLLPEGNLVLYVNLKPTHFFDQGRPSSLSLEPGYEDFVQQTGFQFERDLDAVAISQLKPGGDRDSGSSAIFTGRFDQQRLFNYLKKLSTATETYADKTIFSIPHEGNTVRVCVAESNTVVVTNLDSAEPMHGILDRVRNPALVGAGPYLLEHYYARVPMTSPAWLIYRAPAQAGIPQIPGGLHFDFLENKITVASLRYTGSLLFRAEVVAENQAEAKKLTESATAFLAVYNSVGVSVGTRGPDPDVKALVDSIRIQQSGNSTVFTATIPSGFSRKMLSAEEELKSGKP